MNSAKARFWLSLVALAMAGVALGIVYLTLPNRGNRDGQASLDQELLPPAGPEQLRAHYQPAEVPAGLGRGSAQPPLEPLARWQLDPGHYQGPLAWCPATEKLAFFRDGWIWVTDAQGSRVRTLWFEPDLAAAGQLAWSQDGRRLWLRADGWRHWLSLQVDIEG